MDKTFLGLATPTMSLTRWSCKYQLNETTSFLVSWAPPHDIKTKYLDVTRVVGDDDGAIWSVWTFKEGFAYDGPSGPTWDTLNSLAAALLHDGWYQLIRQGCLPMSSRREADKLLRDFAVFCGMHPARAWCWYIGVRVCARWAASAKNKKKVITVPKPWKGELV